jgi:cell pole-organizing protein PopZ
VTKAADCGIVATMTADQNLDEILASIRKIVADEPQAGARPVDAAIDPEIDDALLDPDFDSEPLPELVAALPAAAAPAPEAAIDAAARALLAPMLKAWLDANLAEIVEAAVAAEISRLTGRS